MKTKSDYDNRQEKKIMNYLLLISSIFILYLKKKALSSNEMFILIGR